MLELREAANESAFHFGDGRTNPFLLFVECQKLALYSSLELTEIRPSDGMANGDKHVGAGFDQHTLIYRDVNRSVVLGLIGKYPGRESCHAIQPIGQKSQRAGTSLGNDAQNVSLIRKDFGRQKNSKIHGA